MVQERTIKPTIFISKFAIGLTVLLALVLLSALFTIPRATAISSQPWKVELLTGSFIFPFTLWVLAGWKKRQDKLSIFTEAFPILISIIAFVAWSCFSMVWATSPGGALHHTLTWSIYLVFFAGFLTLIRNGWGFSIITNTFLMIAVIIGVLCVVDFLSINDFSAVEGTLRIRYGKFAEMLVTVSPLLAATAIYVRTRNRSILAHLAWLLGWLAVMLSLSKGAFLAGIIGHIILFTGCIVFSRHRIRKKAVVLAAVWLIVTIGVQLAFSTLSSIPSTTDYITGAADKTRTTSIFRTFAWRAGSEMAAGHWLIGVGADNFGIAFNEARARLAQKDPANTSPEIGEDYLVERAHNEFLQIFAELGVVGFLLITVLFGSFLYLAISGFRRDRYKASPIFWAAAAGMSAFLVSSMVSSFSFRVVQNGIVFFMVFAVAVNEIAKMRQGKRAAGHLGVARAIAVFGIVVSVISVVFFGAKAVAEFEIYQAERTSEFGSAASLYRAALRFDPDNAAAYYYFAHRYSTEGDNAAAARLLRAGIDRGFGVTVTYSQLAKFQTLAGDNQAAEKTLVEAIGIFPNSVFIRVRYAAFLLEQQRPTEAADELTIARQIDARQANGWDALIREGSLAAFYKAEQDLTVAPPAELRPENAVFEYLDKMPIPDTGTDKND